MVDFWSHSGWHLLKNDAAGDLADLRQDRPDPPGDRQPGPAEQEDRPQELPDAARDQPDADDEELLGVRLAQRRRQPQPTAISPTFSRIGAAAG